MCTYKSPNSTTKQRYQNNATKTHNPKSLQKIKVTAEHQIRKKWFGIYINPGVLPSQICQKRP